MKSKKFNFEIKNFEKKIFGRKKILLFFICSPGIPIGCLKKCGQFGPAVWLAVDITYIQTNI